MSPTWYACALARCLLVTVVLPACVPTPRDKATAPPADAAPSAQASWRWQVSSLPPARVSLAFVASAPVHSVTWSTGGGTLVQRSQPAAQAFIDLAVRAGPGEGLDGFRDDHPQWSFSPVETTTACNQPARRLAATKAAEHIVCVMTATGSGPAYVPARRAEALAFEHHGMPVVVTWAVESDRGEVFESMRAAFFASLICD